MQRSAVVSWMHFRLNVLLRWAEWTLQEGDFTGSPLDHPLGERPGHFPQLTCPCAYLQNPPNPCVSHLVNSPSEGKELSPQDTWIERLPLIHMAFCITHGMSQRQFSLSLESKNGRDMCYLRKILHICESNETCLGRFWILHYHACNF